MKKIANKEAIIQAYQNSISVSKIVEKHHISKQSVYNIIKSAGVPLRRKKLHEGVGCPLFDSTIYNTINCTNCGEWTKLTVHFKTKESKQTHLKMCCNGDYEQCGVYQAMLMELEKHG